MAPLSRDSGTDSIPVRENRLTGINPCRPRLQAPASHFFMELALAAPESGLPSALIALPAQASVLHFSMKEVLAAPASGLPSLPIALLSQVSCANAAPMLNDAMTAARK